MVTLQNVFQYNSSIANVNLNKHLRIIPLASFKLNLTENITNA